MVETRTEANQVIKAFTDELKAGAFPFYLYLISTDLTLFR